MKSLATCGFLLCVLNVGLGCRQSNYVPWLENNAKLTNAGAVLIPLAQCCNDQSQENFTLVGFDSYRFFQAGSMITIDNYRTPDLHLPNNSIYQLNIVGDADTLTVGRLMISDNRNFLFLTLNRFCTRSLGESSLYLTDMGHHFILVLPPFKLGLQLDDMHWRKPVMAGKELKSFPALVSRLSKMEISVISFDLLNRNINNQNASNYENILSKYLARPR